MNNTNFIGVRSPDRHVDVVNKSYVDFNVSWPNEDKKEVQCGVTFMWMVLKEDYEQIKPHLIDIKEMKQYLGNNQII